jgi:hypothetical protein
MKTLTLILATTAIGGLLLAQGPARGRRGFDGPPPGIGGGLDGGLFNGPNVEKRLTRALTLNAEQQNQLHTALAERDVQTKGMGEKMRDLRTQLQTAIRAGDEGKIDQVTRDMATLQQQQQAISAKTLAKVYKSLDASQKGTIDRVLGRQIGGRRPRPGNAPPAVQQ